MSFINSRLPEGWGLGGVTRVWAWNGCSGGPACGSGLLFGGVGGVEFAAIRCIAVKIRERCQAGWTALCVWSTSTSRKPLMAESHVRPDLPGGWMGGSGLLLGAGAGGLDPRRSIGVAADRQASAVISPPPQGGFFLDAILQSNLKI